MLEIRALSPEWSGPLTEFFAALKAAGEEKQFHPHPLTAAEAENRCRYDGKDLYHILVDGRYILAYGMLRGWDEGYAIPSLGIAIRAEARGGGFGTAFMHFLHATARHRGATRVRLKVYKDNVPALSLYRKLGYVFGAEEQGQVVGLLDL